jgi:hypothetical protein
MAIDPRRDRPFLGPPGRQRNRQSFHHRIVFQQYSTMCSDSSSTATRGALSDSGGLDDDYQNSERCSFSITPPAGSGDIVLYPAAFRVEGEGIYDPALPAPLYDYLTIYDGNDKSGVVLGQLKANEFRDPIVAKSGAMFIEWVSDDNIRDHGFDLIWEARGAQAP